MSLATSTLPRSREPVALGRRGTRRRRPRQPPTGRRPPRRGRPAPGPGRPERRGHGRLRRRWGCSCPTPRGSKPTTSKRSPDLGGSPRSPSSRAGRRTHRGHPGSSGACRCAASGEGSAGFAHEGQARASGRWDPGSSRARRRVAQSQPATAARPLDGHRRPAAHHGGGRGRWRRGGGGGRCRRSGGARWPRRAGGCGPCRWHPAQRDHQEDGRHAERPIADGASTLEGFPCLSRSVCHAPGLEDGAGLHRRTRRPSGPRRSRSPSSPRTLGLRLDLGLRPLPQRPRARPRDGVRVLDDDRRDQPAHEPDPARPDGRLRGVPEPGPAGQDHLDHRRDLGGRLDWGIGAGWYEHEYRGYGYEFPKPKDRIGCCARRSRS